jgi:GAF domain-containing protein
MDGTRAALAEFSAGMTSVTEVHKTLCNDILTHVCSTRASIWYFDVGANSLTSACIVDHRKPEGEAPITLRSEDFEGYFEAIKQGGAVLASDALTHPATECLAKLYLVPNGITSLLDFVIKVGPDPVAVLCCEHCGGLKEWTSKDQAYLQGMAVLLKLSFVMQSVAARRQG